ncbi:hypothetical protein [Rhodococcus sp. AH-ZY2]|uniref:hypothetical protein n=1 Tax=Rhodococcus sp. AH-ZY2 TaxID=3047468 RepID=UPI0027DFA92D|nr:hypothetical protein [Rhodococcus sp. AH-ZY2]WML63621.1 hypothetical protein QNA09_02045 [Rhodococcus sp. AH-ZY2]
MSHEDLRVRHAELLDQFNASNAQTYKVSAVRRAVLSEDLANVESRQLSAIRVGIARGGEESVLLLSRSDADRLIQALRTALNATEGEE